MTKEIKLSNGMATIVDEDDYEKLNKYKWFYNSGYARRNGYGRFGKKRFMHRDVLNIENSNELIDHINGDKLDNRKSNLRICSSSQNRMNCPTRSDNTSGYKGVTWSKKDKKWHSVIKKDGKKFFLGSFSDKNEAAKAYNTAAIELHGEYSKLNTIIPL